MNEIIGMLPYILGYVAIVAAMALFHNYSSRVNKKKSYQAKVKAGLIKDGEAIPVETEEEKQAKMDRVIHLLEASKKRRDNAGKN